jgi:hypothetical protein
MNTVGEAIALGTLLQWVLQRQSANGIPIPSSDEAKDAAVLLAEKARKTGACSVGTEAVREFWPSPKEHPRAPGFVSGGALRCSFCFKSQNVVEKLITSPSDYPRSYICNECVQICSSIIDTKDLKTTDKE